MIKENIMKHTYKDLDEFGKALTEHFLSVTEDTTSPVLVYIADGVEVIRQTIGEAFVHGWGARGVHDAYEGGLAYHTYKVFATLINTLYGEYRHEYYTNIKKHVDLKALIIGCIIHDIGKVVEYEDGGNGKAHFVSHPLIGISIYSGYVTNLQRLLNDTDLRILSVIGQHHGEFGEKPQTVEAYLVHEADYLETKLQILDECIERQMSTGLGKASDTMITDSKYIPYKLSYVTK